jgi:hypothetical protein
MSYVHCRQRAPVGNALSSSGTSQLGMFDIQATIRPELFNDSVIQKHIDYPSDCLIVNALLFSDYIYIINS